MQAQHHAQRLQPQERRTTSSTGSTTLRVPAGMLPSRGGPFQLFEQHLCRAATQIFERLPHNGDRRKKDVEHLQIHRSPRQLRPSGR